LFHSWPAGVSAAATLFLCAPPEAAAGAWPQAPGKRLIIESAEFFRAEGNGTEFKQYVQRTYLEAGLLPYVSWGGQLARAQQESVGSDFVATASGISEAELFLNVHRRDGDRGFSAYRLTGAFATSQLVESDRVMGSDAAIELSWLKGIGGARAFAEAHTGYRTSLGADADLFRFDLTLGLKRGRSMLLAQSFNRASVVGAGPGGSEYDLGQLSLSAVLPLPRRFAFEVGGRVDTYANPIDPGSSFFFALWWTP